MSILFITQKLENRGPLVSTTSPTETSISLLQSLMMEGTFHRFAELPWELRDQIWNLAVRLSRPGVQIFKLYDPETEPYLNNAMDVSFDDYYRHNNYGIAIPDRNDNNSSAYLVDGGLWTVCKESRRVMEHRSKSQRASREKINHMQPQNKPDALATGYYKDHDGNSHYFTVLPYQDLFLFQLEDPATIDWEQFPGEIPLGASIWRFHGRLNIALEFKPEWGLQLGGRINKYERLPIVETFSRMVMALGASSYIWLVDYNIRRKQAMAGEESSTPNKEPTAFYARDRRLVEVVLEE